MYMYSIHDYYVTKSVNTPTTCKKYTGCNFRRDPQQGKINLQIISAIQLAVLYLLINNV